MGKATWLNRYTVPGISLSLGMTKTNCFTCQFILFTENYIHIAKGISLKYGDRMWSGGVSVQTRAPPVSPRLLRICLCPELCDSQVWFFLQDLWEMRDPHGLWQARYWLRWIFTEKTDSAQKHKVCTQVQVTTNQPCKVTDAIPPFCSGSLA